MSSRTQYEQEVLDIVVFEIDNTFGEATADLYKKYFSDKKPEEMLETLQGILYDYLGHKKSEEKMTNIKNILAQYSQPSL